jgi:hypothetical protein
MDDRGQIQEVQGFTKVGEEIMKKLEEQMEGNPQAAMLLMQLKNQLNDKAFKKQLQQGGGVLPKLPVRMGSEWEEDSAVSYPMAGSLPCKVTFKVVAIEENIVKIKGEGKAEPKKGEEGDEEGDEEGGGMGMMAKITEGEVTQEIEFDTKIGQLKKRVKKSSMKVESPMGGATVKSDATLELIKIEKEKSEKKSDSEKKEGDF